MDEVVVVHLEGHSGVRFRAKGAALVVGARMRQVVLQCGEWQCHPCRSPYFVPDMLGFPCMIGVGWQYSIEGEKQDIQHVLVNEGPFPRGEQLVIPVPHVSFVAESWGDYISSQYNTPEPD